MANIIHMQRLDGGDIVDQFDIEVTRQDSIPLHFDLTWRAKLRVCWYVLCGRAFTMSGPHRFTFTKREPYAPVYPPVP